MNEVVLGQLLVKSFPHNPTAEQETALYKIAQFIAQPDPHGLPDLRHGHLYQHLL